MKVKCDRRSKFTSLSSTTAVQIWIISYIWNNSYLYCGCRWKWSVIVAVNWLHFHLQPQYRYELFHIYFTSFHCTGRYELNKLTLLPMCGFIAQLVEHRTGIAEVMGSNPVEALIFQASSFQLLKLEKNLLRRSHFTFIYNRSSNMNYFIYISQNSSTPTWLVQCTNMAAVSPIMAAVMSCDLDYIIATWISRICLVI